MIRDLAKRWPGWSRGDVFCAAHRAPHADPNFWNGLVRTERGGEIVNRDNSIMAATIAPTEHINPFRFEIAKCCWTLGTFSSHEFTTPCASHRLLSPFF